MPRRAPDDDLPDGIIPLPRDPQAKEGGGRGVIGCLYGVVALFALLLLVMVVIALFRAWPRPAVLP
jgi:uncharacterized membrane protein